MERRKFMRSMVTLAVGIVAIPLASLVEARVGRPATPASVAGVRRRTRRRTRRRVYVGMSLAYLPYGCTTTMMRSGVNYHYCGGIWYQPQYQGTTVVYVVNQIDPGADTNVEFEEYDE
ncbi:hypothetical protein ACFL3I_05595 [Pseudomonadota bacterium]